MGKPTTFIISVSFWGGAISRSRAAQRRMNGYPFRHFAAGSFLGKQK